VAWNIYDIDIYYNITSIVRVSLVSNLTIIIIIIIYVEVQY